METGYCDELSRDLDDALARAQKAVEARQPLSIGLLGNVAELPVAFLSCNFAPPRRIAGSGSDAVFVFFSEIETGAFFSEVAAQGFDKATHYEVDPDAMTGRTACVQLKVPLR